MKFLALFKKDVKCLMPLFIIALAIFIVIVYMIILIAKMEGYSESFSQKSAVNRYTDTGMCTATWILIIFGFMSGILQFVYFTGQSKTWAFLLHRSANRLVILSSMILSFCFLAIFLGFSEFLFFNILAVAYNIRMDCVGLYIYWIWFTKFWLPFVIFGLLVYLGTILCSLSRSKWFTIKLFPLIFALIVCGLVFAEYKYRTNAGLILSSAAVVILLTQITDLFLKKEV